MRITQKMIARDLGISFMTVSRVFNNSGYVSQELRKQILDYAKKKGYEPHRASQVLVRNTIRNIAVFSSTMPEYFWDDIKKGVMQAAEDIKFFNYSVHYYHVPDFDTKKYCTLLAGEIKNGLNAAAFVCQDIFDMNRIIGMVEKANIPYLLYNVDAAGTGRLCYIGANYRSGGRLAANFIGKALSLKNAGRTLVLSFIRKEQRFPAMLDINSERLEGFLSVMGERFPGISCSVEFVNAKYNIERQIMQ
ncbi:MAG: LacI family transcriptional regulator, partial [Treponema sp.]|nr:LacI family transcriptional regulator [Treponema sp.]